MRSKLRNRMVEAIATGVLLTGIMPLLAQSGILRRQRCEASCEVFQSPYFGYHPTCWRPWPAGQHECPAVAPQPRPLPEVPAEKSKAALPPEMLKTMPQK